MSTAERSARGKPWRSDEMRRTLIAAVHESVYGTFETWRLHGAMSVFERNPEDICSD